MPFDPSQAPLDPLVSQPRRPPPALMIAGMVGACVLGGGLGLWARPTDEDAKRFAARTEHAPAPAAQPRQIEIRVDRPPAPIVAAESVASTPAPRDAEPPPLPDEAPEPQTELLAPKRSPAGLVKVHAVAPERLARSDESEARLAAERKAQARAAAKRKEDAAQAARDAEAREARAEAKAAELRKARKEAARVAEAAQDKARAKAERRLAERRAAEQVAAGKAAAEKRAARLEAEKKAQQLAERKLAERKSAEQKRQAASKTAPGAPAKSVKVAKASTRCASADPGAALACSDPALTAADRQMSRAYRQAEAAGVPTDTLERQQQRWLAARANAARKAPWAVHDIYLARIAELQDQTREAARGEDF